MFGKKNLKLFVKKKKKEFLDMPVTTVPRIRL